MATLKAYIEVIKLIATKLTPQEKVKFIAELVNPFKSSEETAKWTSRLITERLSSTEKATVKKKLGGVI
jgi:hypothetical protein